MGKGKKTFIDRKNAVTFHLVHRSQHDPLVTDETAPQHVLVEAGPRQQPKQQQQQQQVDPVETEKRREEQKKFGIHYDDDYDYLQHLKKREDEVVWEYVENPNQAKKRQAEGNAPKLTLPSSVFASEFEEEEGMLNKAAPHPGPRPDWDPDVVAALDGEIESGDELEDDFVMQAMGGDDDEDDDDWIDEEDESEQENDYDSDKLNEDEDDDELIDRLGPLMQRRFDNEELKSRFTEYSMSSSVIRRNEQLSLLDDRFERFYATYDDPEVGDLSMAEVDGTWHQKHPYVTNCYKEFKKSDKIIEYKKEWDRERINKYRNVVDGEVNPFEDTVEHVIADPNKKEWDCESILSTLNNTYNRPTIIDEPRRSRRNSANTQQQKIEIDPKTGLPKNVLRGGVDSQLTAKALAQLGDSSPNATGPKSLCAKSVLSTLSVLSIRPKDETPEEKRERKRLLKEYRTERRIEKKANAEAFKEEKKRQTHVNLNQRMNQQGAKIV